MSIIVDLLCNTAAVFVKHSFHDYHLRCLGLLLESSMSQTCLGILFL